METQEVVKSLVEGYYENTFITLVAFIFPFGFGVLAMLLQQKFGMMHKLISWASLITECVVPTLAILFVFYVPGFVIGKPFINREWSAIIGLSMAFVFHMPARHDPSASFGKNVLYTGLDLLSTLFKWSIAARVIGVYELLQNAQNYVGYGVLWPLFVTAGMFFVTLFIPECGKRIVKHYMK